METLFEEEKILNVTLLEPRLKHPTIFQWFDESKPGESFTIHNDHDPKPLYYQLLGERGNVFNWQYLEQGPEVWRVRISKKTAEEKDETLGEIAAKDLRKVEVFKKYGLDFCCGGKKTVKEACLDKGLDVTRIEAELENAGKSLSTAQPLRYNDWEPDFLVDYIINAHHAYVRKTMPDLSAYASKVAKVHGKQHTELATISNLVGEVCTELTSHMIKEEKVLFPYIKELVAAKKSGSDLQTGPFNSIQSPISMMEHEHDIVGRKMDMIRVLSDNYSLPEDACASYSILFKILEEFENDLFIHIHLENNILFPKAIALEKK